MVILFFLVQVTNNLALNFKISMPLHMIFRSVSDKFLTACTVLYVYDIKVTGSGGKAIGGIMGTLRVKWVG